MVAGCSPRFSPIWGDEAALFDPLSTEVLVVPSTAARLLSIIQSGAPMTLDQICGDLAREAQDGDTDRRLEIEAMLAEFERLGFVEALAS